MSVQFFTKKNNINDFRLFFAKDYEYIKDIANGEKASEINEIGYLIAELKSYMADLQQLEQTEEVKTYYTMINGTLNKLDQLYNTIKGRDKLIAVASKPSFLANSPNNNDQSVGNKISSSPMAFDTFNQKQRDIRQLNILDEKTKQNIKQLDELKKLRIQYTEGIEQQKLKLSHAEKQSTLINQYEAYIKKSLDGEKISHIQGILKSLKENQKQQFEELTSTMRIINGLSDQIKKIETTQSIQRGMGYKNDRYVFNKLMYMSLIDTYVM
jgi:hypothetical protein